MNLIPCDEKCKHQQEGYCALNQISALTNRQGVKCGYFEAHQSAQNGAAPSPEHAAENRQRL